MMLQMGNKTIDKKRHYLPAGSIGYFSSEPNLRRLRDSRVHVLRKKADTPFITTAANVGYGTAIYGYGKGEFFDHDSYFKGAERLVHGPVDSIRSTRGRWLQADDWSKLAWYITTLIARGPDAEKGLERLVEKGWKTDRISMGYPLNAQRISSAVVRARWEFVKSPWRDFVLDDRGITGLVWRPWHSHAYFIPLRKNFGVVVGQAPYKKQLKWFSDSWHISIRTRLLLPNQVDGTNAITWHAAREQIFGPNDRQLLKARSQSQRVSSENQKISQAYEAAQLMGLSASDRRKDEMLLLSILGGIKRPDDTDKEHYLTI